MCDALIAELDVTRIGACVMVRLPIAPDTATREPPAAYTRADALIRAIRLETVDESYVGEARGLPAWLERFHA